MISFQNKPRYFAYGSNMNPARMRARGLLFLTAEAARLPGYALRFNKQSHSTPGVAYANIVAATGRVVEGVLYTLRDDMEMAKMDVFEGTPVRYSRERVLVDTEGGAAATWVYVANPAFVRAGLLPEDRYLSHLLAGADFLSADYVDGLRQQPCQPAQSHSGKCGLLFND